jgi:GH24 family phage-related lysozyme (muramidase)
MRKIILILSVIILLAPIGAPPSYAGPNKLKISNDGLSLITSSEGLAFRAYYCPGRVLTNGYGHTGRDVFVGQVINEKQAALWLIKDCGRFENHINSVVYRILKQNEFDAFVSFEFNVGYRIRDGTLDAVNRYNHKLVCYKINQYVYAKGKKLPGLVRRRQAETRLYMKDKIARARDRPMLN